MSSEDYEIFKKIKAAGVALRAKYGVPCPECRIKLPKAQPTSLMPGQRCRIHNYTDPRPRLADEVVDAVYATQGIKRIKNGAQ